MAHDCGMEQQHIVIKQVTIIHDGDMVVVQLSTEGGTVAISLPEQQLLDWAMRKIRQELFA